MSSLFTIQISSLSQRLLQQSVSPQEFLDELLCSRGYSCERYESLKSAYFNKPTLLQRVSYQTNLIQMLASRDSSTVETLRRVLSSGISSNPCNAFSESFVHSVCRRGRHDLLQALNEAGCSLQCADDHGRTPLHDCCWAANPAFEVAELILAVDPRLFFMADSRGALPLSYVPQEHWRAWINYLDSRMDILWPERNLANDGEEGAPPLTLLDVDSRPLQDPENALSVELASMVASGKMKPEEAQFLKNDKNVSSCESSDCVDEDEYDDSEYDSDENEDILDQGEVTDTMNDMALGSEQRAT
jgi:hypothetical protein